MTEQRILELLTRKLAGEISSDELAELKELMADYNEAGHMQETTDEIWNHGIEDVDAMAFYQKHLNSHKHDFQVGNPEESIPGNAQQLLDERNYRPLIFMMFGFVALILIGYLFFTHERPKKQIFTELVAGKGLRKELTLPDGTRVWLNGESRISYNPKFIKGEQREVTLSGEAFFEVAKDNQHPFVIKTKQFSVQTLGTNLNIDAYPDDRKSETALLTGSLRLTMNEGSKQSIVLKQGEKVAIINKDQKPFSTASQPTLRQGETILIEPLAVIKVDGKDLATESAWKDDRLIFEDESLEEIAKKLSRWYNVHITVSTEIDRLTFSGIFMSEKIDQVLKSMQAIRKFNYKIDDREIEIY